MICNFPPPYPDEMLYSICARYSDRMHYRAARAASRDLFGYKKPVRLGFPNCLGDLVANLPPTSKHTVTSLINDHTLLPFYKPFLPHERASLIKSAMEVDDKPQVSLLLGLKSRVGPTEYNRFCPRCIEEDRKQFGECYWHRVHQIPGVEVCPSHNVYLQNCALYANAATHIYEYASAEKAISRLKESPIEIKNSTHDDFLKIACDALWLLQNHKTTADLSSVKKRQLIVLAEKGFATYRGQLYTNKLVQAFRQYYPNNFLERLHCELSEPIRDSWLVQLTHRRETVYAPVRHLLLIYFLGYTIETFLNLPTEQKPFGDGPWPCLNPVCDHYRKRCIQECEVIYLYSKSRYPKGIFSCECGFTYSRMGPDHKEEDHFQASIFKSYGSLWEQKLREIWEDPTINISQAARILGVSQTALQNQAKRLGLIGTQTPNCDALVQEAQNNRILTTSKLDSALLVKYRTIWLAVCAEAPGSSVQQLKTKAPKVHRWLYSHDREWLLSNTPQRAPWRPPKFGPRLDWEQRDKQFAAEVKSSAVRILHIPGSPTRLTTISMLNGMSQKSTILSSFDKLPLTVQVLTEFHETPEMFAIRRVQWLAECYQQESVCPTREQFLRRGSLWLPQTRWVTVKHAVDEALRSLNAEMI